MSRMLVIGYGNELRGDDAAGWRLAEQAAGLGWETLCCRQLTPELAATLADVKTVVFADAVAGGAPRLRRLLPSPQPAGWPLHAANPAALLALSTSLFGQAPEAWLLTLPGDRFEYEQELSPTARASVAVGLQRLEKLRR